MQKLSQIDVKIRSQVLTEKYAELCKSSLQYTEDSFNVIFPPVFPPIKFPSSENASKFSFIKQVRKTTQQKLPFSTTSRSTFLNHQQLTSHLYQKQLDDETFAADPTSLLHLFVHMHCNSSIRTMSSGSADN